MRPLAFIIVLLLSLSCGDNNVEVERTSYEYELPSAYVPVDNRNGEQFIAVLNESGNDIMLSKGELDMIDKLLQERVTEYNKVVNKGYAITLTYYKRQYFPTFNGKGEKEVEVNCFCQVHGNDSWKKYRVSVKDGGNCYFNMKLNLTEERVLDFSVNGEV